MRKDAGFEVTDKIKITFPRDNNLIKAINNFNQYISNETLAEKLSEKIKTNSGFNQEFKIGEFDCSINIEKVQS